MAYKRGYPVDERALPLGEERVLTIVSVPGTLCVRAILKNRITILMILSFGDQTECVPVSIWVL